MKKHRHGISEADAAIAFGVEGVEGGDLALLVDRDEKVEGPGEGLEGEGAIDSEGGVELPKPAEMVMEEGEEAGPPGFEHGVCETGGAGGFVGEGGEHAGEGEEIEGGADGGLG